MPVWTTYELETSQVARLAFRVHKPSEAVDRVLAHLGTNGKRYLAEDTRAAGHRLRSVHRRRWRLGISRVAMSVTWSNVSDRLKPPIASVESCQRRVWDLNLTVSSRAVGTDIPVT